MYATLDLQNNYYFHFLYTNKNKYNITKMQKELMIKIILLN